MHTLRFDASGLSVHYSVRMDWSMDKSGTCNRRNHTLCVGIKWCRCECHDPITCSLCGHITTRLRITEVPDYGDSLLLSVCPSCWDAMYPPDLVR